MQRQRNVKRYGKKIIVPDSQHVFDNIVSEHGKHSKEPSPFCSSSDSSHASNLSSSLNHTDHHATGPALRKRNRNVAKACEEQTCKQELSISSGSHYDSLQHQSHSLFHDKSDSIVLCTPVKAKKKQNALKDVNTKVAAKKTMKQTTRACGDKTRTAKIKIEEKENVCGTPENLPDFDSIDEDVLLVDSPTAAACSTPNPQGSTSRNEIASAQQSLNNVSRISDHGGCSFKVFVSPHEEPDLIASHTDHVNITIRRSKVKSKHRKQRDMSSLESVNFSIDQEIERSRGPTDSRESITNLSVSREDLTVSRDNEISGSKSCDSPTSFEHLTRSFQKMYLRSQILGENLIGSPPQSQQKEAIHHCSNSPELDGSPILFGNSLVYQTPELPNITEENTADSDEFEEEDESTEKEEELEKDSEIEDDEEADIQTTDELQEDSAAEQDSGSEKSECLSSCDDPEISRYQLTGHTLSFSEKLSNSSIANVSITAEERVLTLCDQMEPVSFSECIPARMMSRCIKIGEGVYGEVFRTTCHGKNVALKIIPIEGDIIVNDCPQNKFEQILPEIVIAKELSDLGCGNANRSENFCQVNRISCVRGEFPAHLLQQWDLYSKQKTSENDRPDIYPKDQLFIVFEFLDGGCALENFKFSNPREAFSVLRQVVFALAVAEEELEFEHRDLHIGNVLVTSTKEEIVSFTLKNECYEFPSEGVVATIIDFSISRLKKDGCAVFTDVSTDEGLFEGTGDFQFDVYRDMRIENGNDWRKFCPHSNVLWVNYLCKKLVTIAKYKENGRSYRDVQRHLRGLINSMLEKESCVHLATNLSCWSV